MLPLRCLGSRTRIAYNVFIFFYFLSHVFDILVIYLPKKLLNGFDKFAKHTRSYVNFKEYT